MRRIRNGIIAASTAAALAVPLLPAAPAAAQDYDCQISPIGPSHIPGEVVDCVIFILITAIGDPDLPPGI
ncbi:MAG TPA: hypothetical protein VG318_06710 [Actinomycetota bacterium]|nr:hypothetical protein [Actinomycetota bacterium]